MKIKSGFMLREVAGSYVVVAVGERSNEFNGMINLNSTGAFLWKRVERGAEREDLLSALLEEYEVSEEQASKDVDRFIAILTENEFVEKMGTSE